MDVPNIDAVIGYEAARDARGYAHRVGRTARAGRPGVALSLLGGKEEVFRLPLL